MARQKADRNSSQEPAPNPVEDANPAPSPPEAPPSDPSAEAREMVDGSSRRDPEATAQLPPSSPGAGSQILTEPVAPISADPEAPYGRFKNGKPRKNPPKDARGLRASVSPVASPAPQPQGMSPEECAQVATFCNGTFFMILQGVLGPDGAPEKHEYDALNNGLSKYLVTQDIPMTPGLALSLMYAGVLVNRLHKPAVRQTLKEKIAVFYVRLKSRITGRKIVEKAETDRSKEP